MLAFSLRLLLKILSLCQNGGKFCKKTTPAEGYNLAPANWDIGSAEQNISR